MSEKNEEVQAQADNSGELGEQDCPAASKEDAFRALMRRVRDGCPEAARELFLVYNGILRRSVRKRLGQSLRRLRDSEDVAQLTWLRFFEHLPRIRQLDSPERLMAYLSRLAHNLLCNLQDHFKCQKRDLRRDQPLANPATQAAAEIAVHEPSPSKSLEDREKWEQILREKPPEVQNALRLLRDGHSHEEVGAALGVPARMVRRMIEGICSPPVARV
jgi:RNA polymerase sigma factor (sigma-70 family)